MKFFVFLMLLLFSNGSFSQMKSDLWIEGKYKIGFLVAHRGIMSHLAREHAHSGELSLIFQTNGKKKWHKAYKYPTISITGFFTTVGNRKILGEYGGVFSSLNLPLIKREHYVFSTRVGAGMAYTNKIYDKQTNVFNVAISTHFNARITIGFENRFVFGNHSYSLGLDATHFSNSSVKVPNLGLNMPFLNVGYGYRIKKNTDTIQVKFKKEKYWEYGALGVISVKEIFPTGGSKYPIYGMNIFGRRFFGQKTGMEVSFDFISKQAIFKYEEDIPKTQLEILQIGAFVGFILPFDNFHLITGMGFYLKDKYQPEDAMYHRVGMRYVFNNGLNINLVLKSHWARADYTEFGIGYTFKR